MATIVLTAVGTLVGGPIGGAIGAFVGNQIDRELFKPKGREGPRLKELAVTTSSYGTPIPRQFGTMRTAGSIIWATDLVESSEETGGGKGQPSITTFSYSSSFAVALSSRPVTSVGRVWADGNLLRGANGDLKVGGTFRFYQGHGDQLPDPLLATAEGSACPAFRGLAYCVFEDLQLGDFGNRIPALTFELFADDGSVSLLDVLAPVDCSPDVARDLGGLTGFADEGGPLAATLGTIDQLYPLSVDASGPCLAVRAEDMLADMLPTLGEQVVSQNDESFGGASGVLARRRTDQRSGPFALRYYDIARDYQPGLQHAARRALPGGHTVLDFAGALQAETALTLVEDAAQRAIKAQDHIAWRIAELDPSLRPGQLVHLPDRNGAWRIMGWEWREDGVELELLRVARKATAVGPADPGRSIPVIDLAPSPTELAAFELPWDGEGSSAQRQVFAAASSASGGWTGAALYADQAGALVPLGQCGNRRAIIGVTLGDLPAGPIHTLSRCATLDVQLVSPDFALASATLEDCARGANRAVVGEELLQFAQAESLGNGVWRLSGLLRGRGGTEWEAAQGTPQGASFALLDNAPVPLDPAKLGAATDIAAIGLVDTNPVTAPIAGHGRTLQPLAPVHPRILWASDGALTLCWTRRARGAWAWNLRVEPPLGEQSELYEVGLGNPAQPTLSWQVNEPRLAFNAATTAQLQADHSGEALWVRQVGSHDRSPPLLLTTLA